MNHNLYLKNILDTAIKNNASDIHFSEGYFPVFRINRKLVFWEKENISGEKYTLKEEDLKLIEKSIKNLFEVFKIR
jgi:Tfp pilus assembly pilus retraction ATPase PilT